MMNILNGGAHADTNVDIQEFMIAPIGATTFGEALRWGAEVYHALKAVLKGGAWPPAWATRAASRPNLPTNREALDLIVEADRAGRLHAGTDIALALDVAATEFFTDGGYQFEGGSQDVRRRWRRTTTSWSTLPDRVDRGSAGRGGLGGLGALTDAIGDRVQIVGDDLFVTNPERLGPRHREGAANALLVKVNQIGTLSETLDAVDLAHRHGFRCMMSHRSGETEDTTIADLAVATNCGQIKAGAPARSERVAKYNQLLRIEEELDDAARYAGRGAFPRIDDRGGGCGRPSTSGRAPSRVGRSAPGPARRVAHRAERAGSRQTHVARAAMLVLLCRRR